MRTTAILSALLLGLFATSVSLAHPGEHASTTEISTAALGPESANPTLRALASLKPVTAPHAMVVTAQHLATQVGINILKQGGNAIDAAVAIGYALAVVQPCCGNIGGGGFMTIHLANGKSVFLNFREKAPLAATPDMFLNADGQVVRGKSTRSYLAVGVPGTVLGLETALKTYGTMSRAEVMAPAIRLAAKGFVLTPADARLLSLRSDDFAKHPNVASIFLNDGKPYKAGERLRQPELAHTLKLIEQNGADAFYKGPIARKLVAASQKNGGLLTLKDLASYTVQWLTPIRCDYHGVTIISAPPPSSGGTTLCEILQIIQPYPLGQWGYGSVKATHYLVEAERRAYADRNTYLGDPDFVDNPIEQLLSPSHIAKLRDSIEPNVATPSSEISGSLGPVEGMHTTHYSIADSMGNAVATTYTINFYFGIGRIAGDTGFFLNNEMDDFTSKPGVPNAFGLVQGQANAIAAGKRPLSSMTPTIVLKDGKVFMATGSPGGSTIITTTLESILNVVDFNMNLKQAVAAPRIHQQWLPDVVMVEQGYLTPKTRTALTQMGYSFRVRRSWGAVEAILIDPQTGVYKGANDPRRPAGLAKGY